MAPASTQPLTEVSVRNLPRGKGRPAREAGNLTAKCEPTVLKMWEPRPLTTLWASTACYRVSVTFFFTSIYSFCRTGLHFIKRLCGIQNHLKSAKKTLSGNSPNIMIYAPSHTKVKKITPPNARLTNFNMKKTLHYHAIWWKLTL
jgi:hypothetical protein